MTISSITQVYGYRVSRKELFQWILDNPDLDMYKHTIQIMEKDETKGNIPEYIKILDNFEKNNDYTDDIVDKYLDIEYSLTCDLPHSYEITHDHKTTDIVIGIPVAVFNFEYNIGKIDPEYVPMFEYDFEDTDMDDRIKKINKVYPKLFNTKNLKTYTIQDMCECCS